VTELTRLGLGGLTVRVDSTSQGDDALATGNWSQEKFYGGPLWGSTFRALTGRISVETRTTGLVLFDRSQASQFGSLLRFLCIGSERRYAVQLTTSADPLRDGYFTCLRFVASAGEQEHGLAEAMTAFLAHETARLADVEGHLVHCYAGRPIGADPVFRLVDFPAFDNGTMGVGFGLLVEDPRSRVYRLWSRPVHAHK
jgi:hypothetical protein